MALTALYDVAAPAKLNLFLHIVGRRPDGYHLLQSVFVPIDWVDTLHFELRADGAIARHDLGAALPDDDLCRRAAHALQAASGTRRGVDVSIEKRVPWGAGLGGGSSDAASTLLALNRLWSLHWPRSRLAEIAVGLGADVPFFLGRGPALVEGIGERLTPLELPAAWFAVLKPSRGIDTGALFRSGLAGHSDEADIVEGFTGSGSAGNPDLLRDLLAQGRNDLQAAAERECGEVAQAASILLEDFGNSRMTGSGSAVFAFAGEAGGPKHGMRSGLPAGWEGRVCRSLPVLPLAGWCDD